MLQDKNATNSSEVNLTENLKMKTSFSAETFDFAAFYGKTKTIKRILEMNIIGNMEKTARDRLVWPKNSAQAKDASRPVSGNSVVILPTELRTFIIKFA